MANPNPSPETRFGGVRGNKPNGGKTSEQKQAEYSAAEKSAILRERMLSSIMEKVEQGQDPLEFIDAATLKLLKDSEDRAYGTPVQAVDHTTGGDKIPASSLDVSSLSTEALKEIMNAARGK